MHKVNCFACKWCCNIARTKCDWFPWTRLTVITDSDIYDTIICVCISTSRQPFSERIYLSAQFGLNKHNQVLITTYRAFYSHYISCHTHAHTPGKHNAAPISRCIAYEIVKQQTCACVNTAYWHKLHCWKYLSNVCNLNSSFSYEHYEFTIVTIKYLVYFMETAQHIHVHTSSSYLLYFMNHTEVRRHHHHMLVSSESQRN